MTKMLTKMVLAVAACVLMTAARANASDVLDVKVPFPFVVHGQSFPAGQYTLERNELGTSVFLIRGEKNNHASTFLKTVPAAGQDPSGDKPSLGFTRHENQYRLTQIWESRDEGQDVMN